MTTDFKVEANPFVYIFFKKIGIKVMVYYMHITQQCFFHGIEA